jgi:hypothetical protein
MTGTTYIEVCYVHYLLIDSRNILYCTTFLCKQCAKHLHDRIVSVRGEACNIKLVLPCHFFLKHVADKRLILLSLPNIITSHFLKMFYNDWYNIHRGLLCTLFINWFLYRPHRFSKRGGLWYKTSFTLPLFFEVSCIYVLGVMYLCVGGHVFMFLRSCICVLNDWYNIHRGLLCTLFINWFLYRKIFIFKYL